MGYDDHNLRREELQAGVEPEQLGVIGQLQRVLRLLVRLLGLGLILVGLGVGVSVVLESWALYKSPERIERFALAIEKGSGIDQALGSVAKDLVAGGSADGVNAGAEQSTPSRPVATPSGNFRMSYFAGWILALGLMLIVGMLAMSAVTTGARLVLTDAGTSRTRRPI